MPSHSEWESQKDVIRELHLDQNYTLQELRARMNSAGFVATKSQYETKFKAWKLSKNRSNIPATIWKHVGYKLAKRKRNNEDSTVFIAGIEVDPKRVKKEISRHKYSTIERIELEGIGAPSPPGPLAVVATPPNSQPTFSINIWPDNLPWLTFVRSLNSRLLSLHQAHETTRASHHELSALQSKAHGVISLNHDVSALGVSHNSRHVTTGCERLDLIDAILPSSFTSQRITGIQHSMSLLSTTSSHWALKLLIYLASNNFLEPGDLDCIWHLVEETGVKVLATLSESLRLGEASLKAALEHLFMAGVQACRTDIVSWLLDIGADPNRRIGSHLPLVDVMLGSQSVNARSMVCPGIPTKFKSMIYLLLSRGAYPLMSCCEEHKSAAHLAIMNPQVDTETLEMFLQAVTSAQSQERVAQDSRDLCRERGTDFESSDEQQHEDQIFLKMDLLVELLEKSSTSRESLISPRTLIQAVESNNHRLIRFFHTRGLSMNCQGFNSLFLNERSPLAMAVTAEVCGKPRSIETSTVLLLLKLGASPNYNPYPENTNLCSDALQAAVHGIYTSRRASFVKILIENGANIQGGVFCEGKYYQSLMECALRNNSADEELLNTLHDAGLPFPRDALVTYLDHGENYPSYGLYKPKKSVKPLHLLISKTTDWTLQSQKGWTALDYVARTGLNEVEELMIRKGAVHSRKSIRRYCLSGSVRFDQLETLFGRFPTPHNDNQNRSLLFYRVIATLRAGDLCKSSLVAPLVKGLLHDYSKLPRSPQHEAYIILQACATRNIFFIGFTLDIFPDACSPAALEELIRYQTDKTVDYWQFIEELLKRHLNNSSSLQWSQKTRVLSRAIHYEMIGKGDPRILEWFYKNGREAFEHADSHPSKFLVNCLYPPETFVSQDAPTTWEDDDAWAYWTGLKTGLKASTCLGILVAHSGEASRMKNLLQHGLQLNRRLASSPTILQSAVFHRDLIMSRQLLEAGADVNARAAMQVRGSLGHEIYDYTCDPCGWIFGPEKARNALQAAVDQGDLSMIELLLEFGADVNGPPSNVGGVTALQIACIRGYIDIARLLLQNGADVNAAPAWHRGRTALEGAAEHGRLDMVSFLLERGCLVHGSFRMQYIRAVGFARAESHHTVAMTLQNHGDWTTDDENVLNNTDLCDTEFEDCSCEEPTQDDDESSDIDSSESDENCRFPFFFETDSESELGCDNSSKDNGEAPTSENDHPYRTVDECGGSEIGREPATLQRDIWDDLLEYYGDDEAV